MAIGSMGTLKEDREEGTLTLLLPERQWEGGLEVGPGSQRFPGKEVGHGVWERGWVLLGGHLLRASCASGGGAGGRVGKGRVLVAAGSGVQNRMGGSW